jgi:hypothetical protein
MHYLTLGIEVLQFIQISLLLHLGIHIRENLVSNRYFYVGNVQETVQKRGRRQLIIFVKCARQDAETLRARIDNDDVGCVGSGIVQGKDIR